MKTVKIFVLMWCLFLAVSVASAQDVFISIDPAKGSQSPGDVFDATFLVDTGTNAASSFQVAADLDSRLEVWDKGTGTPSLNGIKVDSAWNMPPPPNTPRQEGTVVIFGGAVSGLTGLSGSLTLAVVTLHVKSDAASGDACITFVPSAHDFMTGTFVISTSFMELKPSLTGACYTIKGGPERIVRYDFDADAEGWQFSGTVDAFTPPLESVSGSCLNLQAQDNTNTFGFWYSPDDAIPVLEAYSLYRARFNVNSDQTDKSVAPSFRLRWNASNYKQADMVRVNSSGGGEASPDTTAKDYDLYFCPQGEALEPGQTGVLAFDLINFDPNDAPDATLSLDYVQVDRMCINAVTSTTLTTYTFDASCEGWSFSGEIPPYSPPIVNGECGGTIWMQCNAKEPDNTFGYWQNPQDEFDTDNAVLYVLRVRTGTNASSSDVAPLMRVRMYDHPNNQMIHTFETPVWTEYIKPGGKKVLESGIQYTDYFTYFNDKYGVGANLGIAIDIINLNEGAMADGMISVDEVELGTISPIPSFE